MVGGDARDVGVDARDVGVDARDVGVDARECCCCCPALNIISPVTALCIQTPGILSLPVSSLVLVLLLLLLLLFG